MDFTWAIKYATEFLGTAILIILGNGAVANVELKGTKGHQSGWLVIAVGYGMGVMIPALMFGNVSGNHINPAFTLGLAVSGLFSWEQVPYYILAQVLGAIFGQALVVATHRPYYLQTEKASLEDVTKLSENVTEGFNSIQDKVHNLQEALVGDNTENNPGLIKSVSSAVEELNDNIAKKADKDTVDAELAKKANQADVEANKAEIAKFGAQTNSNAALLLTMAGEGGQKKKKKDEAIAKK